jgi:hypothetical protein
MLAGPSARTLTPKRRNREDSLSKPRTEETLEQERALAERSIQHGRKDFKRMPRNHRIEDNLVGAAEQTALLYGGDSYTKAIETAVMLCGKTIAALMGEEDEPFLFVPIWLQKSDGKEELGCLVTFSDQVIVAWTEGTFRLTYFAHVIPCETVRSAVATSGATIKVEADRSWDIHVQPVFREQEVLDYVVNTFNGQGMTARE